MERILSVEEKIRRAEEIYARKREGNTKQSAIVNVNKDKKNVKLLKKMIIQILICLSIYFVVYTIQSYKYVFSEDFTNKANEVLSYDTNFMEIINNIKNFLNSLNSNTNEEEQLQVEDKEQQEENKKQENNSENGIGGANESEKIEIEKPLSQTEQDIINLKNSTTFIKPVEGIISSKYGQRDTATGKVPKNHTGTDIAVDLGTKIKSSTDGEVVLASSEGDYGKHLKIQIGEVSIIYAHCNNLYVKQGDKVIQGQEIAEVGSTGNSTRPTSTF